MLTAKEIRRKFLKYFKDFQHEVVPSSPLIPRNDPTLLFANSGMVQFKSLFLGEEKRSYVRATTAQKCLRVSGKHNDLENVGRTSRHHTFFEMLGNFSFGDYFKEDAIRMAWTFVTEELKLDKTRLYTTVFRDDDQAFELWQKIAGLAPERIFRLGEKDNFWSMGDTGPCGPCSEIFFDQGAERACGPNCGIGQCDCDRFLEIWNLVFMQFEQAADGTRTELPHPSIDTGMGLERVSSVCQGRFSNFDCDLFQDIIQFAAELAGVEYAFSNPDTNDVDTALRVIADHSRSAAFLIADGTLPSNEGRGYVLRRLLRRALRFGTLMGLNEPFLYKTAHKVTEVMGEDYPELVTSADFIARVVREEEERFSLTLAKGLAILEDELTKLIAKKEDTLEGKFCFKLYDTFGFPLDIVNDIAEKHAIKIDEEGFNVCMQEQKARARAKQKLSASLAEDSEVDAVIFARINEQGINSEFLGYTQTEADSRIVSMMDYSGVEISEISEGQHGFVITQRTPFYGASGGQIGDAGEILTIGEPHGKGDVVDTLKPFGNLTVHVVNVTEGSIVLDQEVSLKVTENDRLACERNHTATHLLHAALRRVLGSHVKQAGSLVAPNRLRFDFTHITALTTDELLAVEREVNRAILADFEVKAEVMSMDAAQNKGAMALFGEKYGDEVRVLTIGCDGIGNDDDDGYVESIELCGGTHLERTGQAGAFFIIAETGIAAGTRRIEASTGWNSLSHMQIQRALLSGLSKDLKCTPAELTFRLEALQAENKKLRKELEKNVHSQASSQGKDLMAYCEQISGITILCHNVGTITRKTLRNVMDDVRSKLASGIACLAGTEEVDGEVKVHLLIYVSKDLHNIFTAPELVRIAGVHINGSGGGRPDFAQAGGTNAGGIEAGLIAVKQFLSQS